jgi:hypothetical protein
VAECYADNATAVTPDQGELRGSDAIANYLRQFSDAFPDVRCEHLREHEAGNVAIDEGYITGTHTASLPMPSGESIPPTGKQIRVRDRDVATVHGGLVTSHHFYSTRSSSGNLVYCRTFPLSRRPVRLPPWTSPVFGLIVTGHRGANTFRSWCGMGRRLTGISDFNLPTLRNRKH